MAVVEVVFEFIRKLKVYGRFEDFCKDDRAGGYGAGLSDG